MSRAMYPAMEGEEGGSFEYNVDNFVNDHSSEASPVEIPNNLSNELGELGSSCGSNRTPVNPEDKMTVAAASTNEGGNRDRSLGVAVGSFSVHSPLNGIGVLPGISSPCNNQRQSIMPWTSLRYQDYLINQTQLHHRQAPRMTNVSDLPYQQNYSMLTRPSVDSRLPQLGHHNRKSDQGLDISPYCNSMPSRSRFQQPIHPANLFELQVQSYNSWKNRQSLTLSGAHVGGHEGLANQNAERINNPQISQQSQLFNISETLQNGFLGGHLGKRPSEIGESSPSNHKFSRVESGITQENQGAAWRHQDKLPIQLNLRPAKNALYDPGYDGVGLPVDPHLRLFALN